MPAVDPTRTHCHRFETGVFPVFETGFRPRVGKVDEKDQTDENEDGGSEG